MYKPYAIDLGLACTSGALAQCAGTLVQWGNAYGRIPTPLLPLDRDENQPLRVRLGEEL
jgi:hypothetical protein